jgi:undecaprenyl phosphate N,N'-diacetylbacillosamine 1-phosphate transferase
MSRQGLSVLSRDSLGKMYRKYFKRVFDFVCSLLALIVLSPVLLITALLVRIKLGTPVIFKQKRPGLNEKIFTLYKFRTMTDQKDEQGNLLPDEVRLTKFGKMLRSTSLDELPELWNILKGDMSVVGPRPLAVQYLPYYTDEERKRHSVRPGLTGLAQVNGRNTLSWERRFELDANYAIKISFIGDLKILFRTLYLVVKRSNVSLNKLEDFDSYREKRRNV